MLSKRKQQRHHELKNQPPQPRQKPRPEPEANMSDAVVEMQTIVAHLDLLLGQQTAEIRRLKAIVRRVQRAIPKGAGVRRADGKATVPKAVGAWLGQVNSLHRVDWDAVDWKLRNAEIARQYRVTPQRVSKKRRELGATRGGR